MRIILLQLIPVMLSFSALGQHVKIYHFNRERYIKQSNYGKLRVIDLREDTADLGDIQTGMLNTPTRLVTKTPIGEVFSSYFKYMLPKDFKSDKELLLALYVFKIADRPIPSEMGAIYFSGDFYCDSNGVYSLLGHVDTFIELSASWDVSNKLLQASQILVGDFLEHYAQSAPTADAEFRYSDAQVQKRRRTEKEDKFPIYAAGQYRKGIYKSVDSFLGNQASDTSFKIGKVSFTENNPRFIFYYTQSNGKKGERIDAEDYFAIYDGEDWYWNQGRYWVRMNVSNGDFYVTKSFKGIAGNTNAIVMFGLVGALATSGSSGKGEYWAVFDPGIKEFRRVRRVQ